MSLQSHCIFLTYGVIKNRIHYFPLCPRIRLDIISTDFVLGKLLNTTNAVRFSMAMFSWQPLLRILICRFIYSARLRSKLNGKKKQPHSPQKSFTDHRRREWSCFSPEKGVIITFPIFVRMAFLNEQQTFMAGQPGMSPIKITANGIELPLGEAEMKIFKRSALCGFAACSHVPFSRSSLRSPYTESLLTG